MDAACKGAFEANKPVGGFKIAKESGEWTSSNFHPYLPPETYLTCRQVSIHLHIFLVIKLVKLEIPHAFITITRFFSARKHALVDAVVREDLSDMTAVIAFPGGIGTLDEVFEILALIQLERIGSKHPVPFLVMNYNSFYSKLLDFLDECEMWGTVAKGEVGSLWKVCNGNLEALEYLAQFYDVPQSKRNYDVGVVKQDIIS